MARSRFSLTPQVQESICAFIRSGGFPNVAAEAAGIPAAIFQQWLKRGQAKGAARRYRRLDEAVRRAQAEARLAVEIEVRQNKPLDWLKSGPGKDAATTPGWSAPPKAQTGTSALATHTLVHAEAKEAITRLVQALAGFPEARTTAAQAIAGFELLK